MATYIPALSRVRADPFWIALRTCDGTEAAAKPKRTTKKAAADKADDHAASDGTAEAANAPEAAPTEEVAT